MVTRDSDLILLGMILIVVGAALHSLNGSRYTVYFGNIFGYAEFFWVAGLIVITVGLFRFVRRVEARLAT